MAALLVGDSAQGAVGAGVVTAARIGRGPRGGGPLVEQTVRQALCGEADQRGLAAGLSCELRRSRQVSGPHGARRGCLQSGGPGAGGAQQRVADLVGGGGERGVHELDRGPRGHQRVGHLQKRRDGLALGLYDHRDTGGSTSHPPGEVRYTTETLADDALAVLDAYDVPRAHLVGMSLGGYLAQIAALAAPARVASLTLIASERLALTDPAMPAMDPRIPEYHTRAQTLDWTGV